uniref:PAR1 protein n=1 Tax=Cannabis sativa TaxID=3483 RepID=A0A803QGB5_CANSA
MAFSKLPLALFMSTLFFQAALGEIVCEELPLDVCAFAVASSGKRCLLETSTTVSKDGGVEYQCRTSEVVVERLAEHIETEKCVKACGVDRKYNPHRAMVELMSSGAAPGPVAPFVAGLVATPAAAPSN